LLESEVHAASSIATYHCGTLSRLPLDIIRFIIAYVLKIIWFTSCRISDAKSVISLERSCKQLHHIVKQSNVFKMYYKQDFPMDFERKSLKEDINWNKEYPIFQ
jgi:hypothetical protein